MYIGTNGLYVQGLADSIGTISSNNEFTFLIALMCLQLKFGSE